MIYLPQRYFSKSREEDIAVMNEMFCRKGIFFIEKIDTQCWLEEVTQMGIVTTIDPLKAIHFDTKMQAMTFMVRHSIGHNGWHVTEHEFPETL